MIQQTAPKNDVFIMEHTVMSSECDNNYRMKLSYLLRNFQDVAVRHCEVYGMDRTYMLNHHFIFLLSRISIKIAKMPENFENIIIHSWGSRTKGVFVYREFEVYDTQGSILAEASSAWILVDPDTRQILRPNTLNLADFAIPDKFTTAKPPEKIKSFTPLQQTGVKTVLYSDIDCNAHLNNAEYADMICDYFPTEINRIKIKEIMLSFVSEAKYKEQIPIYAGEKSNGVMYMEGRLNDSVCFQSEIHYE